MENLEKEIDCKVTMAFRNTLVCKKCDIFPRSNVEVMRCAMCKNILCGKCCGGTKCPLCQHESKNPKFPTFIKDTELIVFLSGFKTHPCINVKNGCQEEIPATLDTLTAHDQSCVFQKVPCPDCKDTVIFKDFGQHLKQDHVINAGKVLGTSVKGRYRIPNVMSTANKELKFEGTKDELFYNGNYMDKFFCVNAYDRQFYPQFKEIFNPKDKEISNCLYVRTLMLGFQEETIPFKVEITFYLKNGENFKYEDKVYPITKGENSILKTSILCHFEKLTEYYDAKTRELKTQTKIDFSLKIISPKLDEIAKDQHIESGIEDTDEEMNEEKSTNGKKRKVISQK